ncbi:hypothetical protein E2C01_093793 [Portunus trituberculatus]|uniref:Uncharacterized protein n=1 Tax=Portunus trituberculatus TaxID=210409 RepID=A0A5B7JQR7_PORTR|nr:hypothetical protein [Portunus trituberculatus]
MSVPPASHLAASSGVGHRTQSDSRREHPPPVSRPSMQRSDRRPRFIKPG